MAGGRTAADPLHPSAVSLTATTVLRGHFHNLVECMFLLRPMADHSFGQA